MERIELVYMNFSFFFLFLFFSLSYFPEKKGELFSDCNGKRDKAHLLQWLDALLFVPTIILIY